MADEPKAEGEANDEHTLSLPPRAAPPKPPPPPAPKRRSLTRSFEDDKPTVQHVEAGENLNTLTRAPAPRRRDAHQNAGARFRIR